MAWTQEAREKAIIARKQKGYKGGYKLSENQKQKLIESNIGRRLSDDTKHKISLKRKEWLKNNPDKHPWRKRDKFKSKPCEKLKNYLNDKGIHFVEEWIPLDNRHFSIDIAFPDIKLGIDVNGNQHYNTDGTLKPYYQERHDLIVSAGWTLIELHYSTCFKPEMIDILLEIKEQPDYTEYFKIKQQRQLEKLKNESLPRGQKQTIKYEELQKTKIEAVKQANIDFTKFGWVAKLSTVIGICPQKASKWLKRFMPDVYENSKKKESQKATL